VTEHADRTYRTNPAEWGANLTGHITADAARHYSTWQTKRRLSLLIRVKNRFLLIRAKNRFVASLRHKLTLNTDR
jgi:hypothetical protein